MIRPVSRTDVKEDEARRVVQEEMRRVQEGRRAEAERQKAEEKVLEQTSEKEKAAQEMAGRICHYLGEWSGGRLRTETIVFSNRDRELVRTQGALELLQGELL